MKSATVAHPLRVSSSTTTSPSSGVINEGLGEMGVMPSTSRATSPYALLSHGTLDAFSTTTTTTTTTTPPFTSTSSQPPTPTPTFMMTPTPVFTPPSSSSFHPRATSASLSNVNAQQRLLNPPTFIQFKGMQFLIMDAPTDGNLNLYLAHFQPHGVTDMVHACDPTYTIETLESVGIKVHDLNFKDGDPPPPNIVSSWLNLVAHRFQSTSPATSTSSSRTHTFSSSSHFPIHSNPSNGPSSSNSTLNSPVTSAGPTIAIHCVAGLGRAPVLVAIALIEAGMPNLEAVDYIRSRRRGALNVKQIQFLDSYKRKGKPKFTFLTALEHSSPPPPSTTHAGGSAHQGPSAMGGATSTSTSTSSSSSASSYAYKPERCCMM